MPDGRVARFEVPEGTTPEQAQSAFNQFASQQGAPSQQPAATEAATAPAQAAPVPGVSHVPGQVPGKPDEDVPVLGPDGTPVVNNAPPPDRRIGNILAQAGKDYVGRGETALALATGLTGGTAGLVGGTIKGVLDEVASGKLGTRDAADRIEKAATEGASALTYAPRTESGQRQTQAVGEALAPLAAIGPMVSEGAALASGAQNIPAMARAAMPARAAAGAARVEPEIGVAAQAAKAAPEAQTAAPIATTAAAAPAEEAGVWTWKSGGKEHPVDVLPQTYTSPDGKNYQRVLYQGKETFVAADDLVPPTKPPSGSSPAPAAGQAPETQAAPAAPAQAAAPGARVEPSLGDMGQAPAAPPTAQQSIEGLAKSITESTQASKKKQIPTMERLAAEVQPDETILQAADRLGLKDELIPSQYSRSQAYREVEQGLASIPGSQLNAQQKQAATMLAQKADDLIQQYGGDIDKAALSSDFRAKGLSTIEGLTKQSDDLYDKVRQAIPPTTKITADSTVGYLTNKAKELGGAEALSPIERRTLSMLSGGTRPAPIDPNSPASLASYGQTKAYERILPTYSRVDQLRKQVGEGLRGRGAFKDSESGSLKQLYAHLSDDQQGAANSLGVGDMFSAAKQLVGSRKAIEDNLAGVLGKDLSGAITAKTGTAIRNLSSGNYKEFDKVMSAIPEDMRQRVVMTSLNDAFTAGSRMEKQLSAPGFVDWHEGLKRNVAARDRLYKYLPPEARTTLDDIAKVAKGMRDASKERITTGRIQALMENFATEGGMLSKLYGVGKQVALAEGAGSAVGLPGAGTVGVVARLMTKEKTPIMKAADQMLASQQFKNALNEYARTGGDPKRAAVAQKALEKTPAYKAWFSALSNAQKAAVRSNGAIVWLSQPVHDVGEGKPSK